MKHDDTPQIAILRKLVTDKGGPAALLCTSAVLFAGAAVTSATNRVADAIKASQPDQ